MTGKIIIINGASSAGKSTLCQALQAQLAEPFWHVSIDHFIAARMLPQRREEGGAFAWQAMRPHFFEGFHRCLPALAAAGNNLLVEHIVETAAWMERLLRLLAPYMSTLWDYTARCRSWSAASAPAATGPWATHATTSTSPTALANTTWRSMPPRRWPRMWPR